MWVLLLVACGGDRFSGRLLSPGGTPLAAVPVSVDGSSGTEPGKSVMTDSDGRFELPPGAEATFTFGHVTWTTGAAAGEHELHLPEIRRVNVRCPADDACSLALRWPEAGGLRPSVERACTPGDTFDLDAPTASPEASCEHPDRALVVDDRKDHLDLRPFGREIDITVVAADGSALPDDCATFVDGVRAKPVAAGRWTGEGRGAAWVGGQCRDRAMAPVLVPRDGVDAALTWASDGPDWDASGVAPWAKELRISDERGLSVAVKPEDGVFHLPPLPPGDWRVTITGDDPRWGSAIPLPQATGPGLTLTNGGEHVLIGVWRVPDPPTAGPVPTR